MLVRCPFCHRLVLKCFYKSHERKHTRRRADGQMEDHVTLPEAQRTTESLENVPRSYRHDACGVVTGMPEEIIRTYLVNPLTYADWTFCGGCGAYVHSSEVNWIETGEKVVEYMGRLRAEHLARAYGSDFDDRSKPILVTPEAVQEINRLMKQFKASGYLALKATADGHVADLALDHDPKTEVMLESNGVKIIVPKDQVDRLRGLVVHFQASPQRGFAICRRYAAD